MRSVHMQFAESAPGETNPIKSFDILPERIEDYKIVGLRGGKTAEFVRFADDLLFAPKN